MHRDVLELHMHACGLFPRFADVMRLKLELLGFFITRTFSDFLYWSLRCNYRFHHVRICHEKWEARNWTGWGGNKSGCRNDPPQRDWSVVFKDGSSLFLEHDVKTEDTWRSLTRLPKQKHCIKLMTGFLLSFRADCMEIILISCHHIFFRQNGWENQDNVFCKKKWTFFVFLLTNFCNFHWNFVHDWRESSCIFQTFVDTIHLVLFFSCSFFWGKSSSLYAVLVETLSEKNKKQLQQWMWKDKIGEDLRHC